MRGSNELNVETENYIDKQTDKNTDNQTFWRKWEPAVPIPFHYLLTAAMWIYVGKLLISYGVVWFQEKITKFLWLFILVSVIGALSIYKFGFSKIVYKNITRLQQKRDKICIFAFMEWKSYMITVIMMTMGIMLRTFIGPNEYLGVMYIGIGGGLLLSGLIYFKPIIQLIKNKIKKKSVESTN